MDVRGSLSWAGWRWASGSFAALRYWHRFWRADYRGGDARGGERGPQVAVRLHNEGRDHGHVCLLQVVRGPSPMAPKRRAARRRHQKRSSWKPLRGLTAQGGQDPHKSVREKGMAIEAAGSRRNAKGHVAPHPGRADTAEHPCPAATRRRRNDTTPGLLALPPKPSRRAHVGTIEVVRSSAECRAFSRPRPQSALANVCRGKGRLPPLRADHRADPPPKP